MEIKSKLKTTNQFHFYERQTESKKHLQNIKMKRVDMAKIRVKELKEEAIELNLRLVVLAWLSLKFLRTSRTYGRDDVCGYDELFRR